MTASPVWRSEHEYRLPADAAAAEARLRAVDAAFGEEVSQRYGATGTSRPGRPKAPLFVRIPRAAFHQAAISKPGRFARRVGRRLRREVWRREVGAARRARRHAASATGAYAVHPAPSDAASGNAILEAATTPHLVFVREDGLLLEDGAAALDRALGDDPDVELVYGDCMTGTGIRVRVPAFSPFRLRCEDGLGPVVAVSTAALRRRGGFDAAADGVQLLDLGLRTRERGALRLRTPLGVGRAVDEPVGELAGRAAALVEDRLRADGVAADVSPRGAGRRRVEYEVAGTPLVSVVIPTRGSSGSIAGVERVFVVEAIRGILERSSWQHLEFVVVADDATPQPVVDELVDLAGDRLRLVRWDQPFNFSAKMNRGAAAASGDFLLLLNDDVDLVAAESIERMLGVAQQPGVGMAGALLFFEDGTVQHVGHLYHRGSAGHADFEAQPGALLPIDVLAVDREVSGVTAACALITADLFAEVGGFSLEFPGNYNDVDLSLKVRESGRSVICVGDARLYHFESKTRDATVLDSDVERLHARWRRRMERDEFSRELER